MKYGDLTATQRDALTAAAIIDADARELPNGPPGYGKPGTRAPVPSVTAILELYRSRFGDITRQGMSKVLRGLVDESLLHSQRTEYDGRLRIYPPTDAGRELVSQALIERLREIDGGEGNPLP